MATHPPYSSVSQFIHRLQTQSWIYSASLESTVPIVSIISSFFNAHRYFEETYRCIVNQTFQNFEWIIVDDGSTDPDAIALFQSLGLRPKITALSHATKQGPSAGRNTAIAQATGRYLFFIDLDDLIDPSCIEKCVLFLETHPDFSWVNTYSVGFQEQEYWWNYGFDQPARFFEQNWVTGRLLYRKVDFDSLGGFDETLRVYEDWERWLRAIAHGQQGWTLPEYLDCYRRTETGLLAQSLSQPDRDEQAKGNVRDRYRAFFSTQQLPPIHLNRSRFDVYPLRDRLNLINPLKRTASTQQVLCCFPHLEMGGADRFNLDLLTVLAARGYGFTIVTTLPADHVWHSYFYAITPDIFHLTNVLDCSYWLACLHYLIESRQIDVVLISNCYIAYYFLPFLRQAFPQVAFVDFTHTTDPGWRGQGYPRLSCQFSYWLDRQVVTSQWLAGVYRKIGAIDLEKLQVCYTNIAANRWQPNAQARQQMRAQLSITDETAVLLYPARLVEQKRPLFLVDLVKALVAQTPSIAVLVVGDGDLRPALEGKIRQLGLTSYFHLLPPVLPLAMGDIYAAADLLLLPSAYEGVALAIYEAMAMALPVVASDVGGQSELVTPETGYLLPLGNSDQAEVQAYLDRLLPLVQTPSLRQRLGEQARQRVTDFFSLEAMADRMETVFQEAIDHRQHQPVPEVNLALAEEMLMMTLEYLHQEQLLDQVWGQKRAMESSKFWQLRKQWFNLKRWLRLTQE